MNLDPADIAHNKHDLHARMVRDGGGERFIASVAESLAFQQALVRYYKGEMRALTAILNGGSEPRKPGKLLRLLRK